MSYSAVIVAAGLSSRMHEFKPMLCIGETTLIDSTISNLRNAGVSEIIVVTGYKGDVLRKHFASMPYKIVFNPDYAESQMFDSVRLGLENTDPESEGVFITPADVPLVKSETIRAVMDTTGDIVIPYCGEQSGHPVLIRNEMRSFVMNYKGDGGLGGAIANSGIKPSRSFSDDIGITMDADTPKDFEALKKLSCSNNSNGSIWADIQINIGKGLLCFNSQTIQLLDMIDHLGSLQLAANAMHMSYPNAWKKVNDMEAELGYKLLERTAGGQNGGGSTLTEKASELVKAYYQYRENVREYARSEFKKYFGGF